MSQVCACRHRRLLVRRQFIGQFYRASLHGRNSEIGEVMSPDISRSPNGTLFASDDSDRIPRCTQGRRPERAQDSSSGQAKGRWPRSAARGKARQQLKSPGQGRQDWSLKCLAISILTGWTFDNWNTFCRPSRATYPRIRDRGRRRRAACPRLPTNSSHNSLFCKLLVKQVTSPFLGWWPLLSECPGALFHVGHFASLAGRSLNLASPAS